MTTISIVEDSPVFQDALVKIIEESDEFAIADIYSSAEEAMEISVHKPDLAIVDIALPGMNGIELIRKLKARPLPTLFLICSLHDDDDKIVTALESGASGYILKDSTAAQIKEALLEVVRGGAPMSPYVAKRVISFFKSQN